MEAIQEAEHAVDRGDANAAITALSALMGNGGLTPIEQTELRIALAREFQDAGKLDAAAEILGPLLTSLQETGADIFVVIETLDLLADIELRLGEANSALAHIRQAIELSKQIEGRSSEAIKWRLSLMKRALEASILSESEIAVVQSELKTRVDEQSRDEMTGMRRYQGAESEIKPEEVADFRLVSVHYGTHRNRTGRRNPYDFYGAKRAEMSYGKAIVSIPKNREVGTITRPPSRAESRYDEYRFDPGRHFIIKTVDVIGTRELFLEDLTEAIDVSGRKEALVFVHGYNSSFADAVIRAAQLAVDLEIDGATVAYSWPSRASLLSYVVDRNQVIGPFLEDLKDLIASVATATGATRVHLIAHSMGGAFLLEALEALAQDHAAPLFDEIIFASPDVDVDDFNYGIGKIRHLAPRVTVYSSSNDRALQLSERINGGVRAGASAERVAACGADAVDTTSVAQGFIAHTDFAYTALDDVRAVVWIETDLDPERRDAILRADEGQWGRFWRFMPEEPRTEDGPFREALVWVRRVGLQKASETAANLIAVVAVNIARAAERARLEKIALALGKFAR